MIANPAWALFAALAFCAGPAAASGAGAFARGDFAAARSLGQRAGTAEGSSLACKSGLVLASYFETATARVQALHEAIGDCAAAIEAGAATADVYVDYAVGLAFESRRTSNPKYAAGAKRLLGETIARFPRSAFAHGALGGWHAAVARRGRLARIALGASRDEARKEFLIALRLDPGDIAITSEYVRFLAGGNRKDRLRAAAIAAEALTSKPKDAFEALLLDRIQKLAQTLEKSPSEIDGAIETFGPFAGIAGEKSRSALDAPFIESFPDGTDQGKSP